eukprot:TRINITY_DN27038_c0_g1_i1.p1 TRINITY_DN27038_c0_g1~~TRINITY_DN27038_c0_g1_i1.p1  ORF type:complete len:218 (-),score=22.14 TRINITY_DN27038_c0_g1_i1:54-707(-)
MTCLLYECEDLAWHVDYDPSKCNIPFVLPFQDRGATASLHLHSRRGFIGVMRYRMENLHVVIAFAVDGKSPWSAVAAVTAAVLVLPLEVLTLCVTGGAIAAAAGETAGAAVGGTVLGTAPWLSGAKHRAVDVKVTASGAPGSSEVRALGGILDNGIVDEMGTMLFDKVDQIVNRSNVTDVMTASEGNIGEKLYYCRHGYTYILKAADDGCKVTVTAM